MVEKIQSTNKNEQKTKKIKMFFPIKFTTVIIFALTVGLMMFTMYTMNNKMVTVLRRELSSFFISNLNVFKEIVQNEQYENIERALNNTFGNDNFVKFIVVRDKEKELFSTLNSPNAYNFLTPSPDSFRLNNEKNFGFLVDRIEYMYIEKDNKFFYIGIYKSNVINDTLDEMRMTGLICIVLAFVFAIMIALSVTKTITKPLEEMEETISKIGRGDLSNRLEYTRYNEINKLVLAYNMMANALQRLYSSLEAQVNDRTKKLKDAYTELKSTQAMMVHSEKMKSLGELVAGIMHEINNPINFIYGNMTHLSNYSNDLIMMIDKYTEFEDKMSAEDRKKIQDLKKEIDYDFLKTDMPDLIKSCKEGSDRAKNIIQDLKSFSRVGEAAITDVDIVSELDTTLNILHNKIKHKVTVHKEYIDYVPKIEAFGGQLNQVFMNILDNAIGAIKNTGDVWIRIKTDDMFKKLIIEIEDNGEGMEADVVSKVFDPFFTTKPVGQGTGLGMSITHKIVKNHQGDIEVNSIKGTGTKFTITLPINLDREQLSENLVEKGANE